MRLSGKTVTLILSEEVRPVFERAGVSLLDPPTLEAYVHDTDELGLWIVVPRGDREHVLLVQRGYVLTMDMPAQSQAIGLTG